MLKELLEQRATLQAKLQALADADTLTDVQEQEWETITNEISALDAKISRKQAAAASDSAGQLATANAAATPGAPGLVAPPAKTGLNDKEERDLQAFSFIRAFASANDPRTALDGLEAEMHQEASKEAKDAGITLDAQAIGVPQIILEAGSNRQVQNSHTVTGAVSYTHLTLPTILLV